MGLAGIKTYSAIMCKIVLGVGQLRTHLKVVYLLLNGEHIMESIYIRDICEIVVVIL